MNLLVSVIIPCFNVENYIEEAINSCLTQTYKNIEIICVDNGSTDTTIRKIEAFAEVKIFKESKKGAPYARNTGLQNAKGDWIQFLDADDILLPNKIEQQMQIISTPKSGEVDLIFGKYSRRAVNSQHYQVPFETKDIWLGLLRTQLGITSSNLWRRVPIVSIGGWNTDLKSSQEYELIFGLLKAGYKYEFDATDATIVRDREQGSISKENDVRNTSTYVRLRIEILKFLYLNRKQQLPYPLYCKVVFGHIKMEYALNKRSAFENYTKFREVIKAHPSDFAGLQSVFLQFLGFKITMFLNNILATIKKYYAMKKVHLT